MNQQSSNDSAPANHSWNLGRFLAATVGFGVLMGLRDLGPNLWVRMLLAGAAFGWLSWLALSRMGRRSGSCC